MPVSAGLIQVNYQGISTYMRKIVVDIFRFLPSLGTAFLLAGFVLNVPGLASVTKGERP